MHPILESWSGISLKPIVAYGFRLYRNQSSLIMHLDETRTHVISCIYHIASSENAQPWPLLIEDFEGNTNEVILTPGDVLLYVRHCGVLLVLYASLLPSCSCNLSHIAHSNSYAHMVKESSKCVHGRPSKFNGDWYSSIFVHFAPASIEWAVSRVLFHCEYS